MKIGLFGGTFNPPHLGHLLLAEQCMEKNQLDEIWFIPNTTSPFKQDNPPVAGSHRLNMLALAINDFHREYNFKIEDYEIYKSGVNYTWETIKHFRSKFPRCEFYLIVGEDINIDEWTNPEYIKENVNIITFNTTNGIRSSHIRQRIKEGKSIKFQVPPSVEEYIYENKLYG